jgi:hypothetical protein
LYIPALYPKPEVVAEQDTQSTTQAKTEIEEKNLLALAKEWDAVSNLGGANHA